MAAKKILIADDELDLRVMLGDFFSSCGYQIVLACDGLEALVQARQCAPDILVLDLSMPGMNGWDVARSIRQDAAPAVSQVPIIAFTAHALKGEEERAREAGCDSYVSKPFNFDYLLSEIKRLLSTPRS